MWTQIMSSAWPVLLLLGSARSATGRPFQPFFQSSFITTTTRGNYHYTRCNNLYINSGRSVGSHRRPSWVNRSETTTTTTRLYANKKSASSSSTRQELKTLQGTDIYAAEEVIKKSRFIGYASYCTSWDDAQSILQNVRSEHPKSRHVCFGFVSSSSGGGDATTGVGTERCSDDGEPTGTAGVPILGAIKGEGLSDVLCIVVRYFGGIKLGAGGLIRAYGGAARSVLRSAPIEICIPQCSLRLSTRSANSGAVYAAAAKYGGVTGGEAYNDRGELEVTITCDDEFGERLREEIVDATRGGVMFL